MRSEPNMIIEHQAGLCRDYRHDVGGGWMIKNNHAKWLHELEAEKEEIICQIAKGKD